MFCVLNVVCAYYIIVPLCWDINPVIMYPNHVNDVDQYQECIGCFNNIVRCKQRTCNTTQYIFHRTNFSYSQYKGVLCSFIILFSCSESLLATTSCSWLLHPNSFPLAYLSISHINARSLYMCGTDFKSNRTQSDEIDSALFLQYRFDNICVSEKWLQSNIACENININHYR
jgi:hypothetical protein